MIVRLLGPPWIVEEHAESHSSSKTPPPGGRLEEDFAMPLVQVRSNLQDSAKRLVAVAALAFLLSGFDVQDAKDWINGQWEGRTMAWSLSVDTKAGTAIFIDGAKRLAGAFVIEEVVGRSARFRIGDEHFTIHFRSNDSANLSVGGSEYDFVIERVK